MTDNATRRLTAGRALAEILKLHDAGPMFGMGGFQLLPFYHAMLDVGLTHTLVNEERCGAFAADGWTRITGRPGICDGTLGPGATNLITGLVESLNTDVPADRDPRARGQGADSRGADPPHPGARPARLPDRDVGAPGPVVRGVPEDVTLS